jgi:hypothetical protein
MTSKLALVTGLLLAYAGAAQAQAVCSCNAQATRTADQAMLTTLLSGKMVCGNVGSERWQEWHNGSSSGPIVDYKLGPTHPVDPSKTIGNYTVNADNTVTYNYGAGAPYTYDVCFVAASNTYTYCGANYGGRNITSVRIGGAGLQNCDFVANTPLPSPPPTATNARTVKR